jgi:tetratricopeptide (TPR) repeat protein
MKKYLLAILFSLCLSHLSGNQTPDSLLLNAVKNNNLKKVKELVAHGANVNTVDENNATALMWAVYKADMEIIRFLVNSKADYTRKGIIYLDTTKNNYYGNLTGIAAAENKPEVLKYLIKELSIPVNDKEINVKTGQMDGWEAIHEASYKGHYAITKYLLDNGADVNAVSGMDGGTAIIYASNGNDSLVNMLIKYRADINHADMDKNTALHHFAWAGNLNGCRLLVTAGAKMNARNSNGWTPLHIAANGGNLEVISLLMTSGADTTLADNSGKIYSAYFNWISLINKVDTYEKSANYNTALYYGEKAKKQAEAEFGKASINYAATLNALGICNIRINNTATAVLLYSEAIEIFKKLTGADQRYYISALNSLAYLYNEVMGDYSKAKPLYIESLDLHKKLYGTNNPEYANSLNSLAVIYYDLGDYSKAEPLYIEALGVRKKILGTEHPDYARSLNNLGYLYRSTGNYSKAEPFLTEALNVRRKVLGTSHPDYAESLHNLAELYVALSDYSKAEPLYAEALRIRKKVLGVEHPDYANSLTNLAALYQTLGNYTEAEPLFIEALNIRKKSLGQEHHLYALSLNYLAELYENMGYYSKAEPLLTEALNIQKKVLGTENLYYSTTLDNLAKFYETKSNYAKAEPLYIEVLNIRKKINGEDHSDYAIVLDKLAGLYVRMGNYTKAETLYVKALNIQKKTIGTEHPEYANVLSNFAILYRDLGNYSKAEQLNIEAFNIRKKTLGTEHPDYANSLINLAELHSVMGNYSSVEIFFKEALIIKKKALGAQHPDYATALGNLGLFYEELGNYFNAEPLLIEALNIRKKAFGPEHPNNATSLNNLASLYYKMGNYSKAEPLYVEALNIQKKVLGSESADYATYVDNLAVIYYCIGNYSKAALLFTEALNIRKKILGTEHPDYANGLNNAANLYQDMGNYAKAEASYTEALNIQKKALGTEHPDYTISLSYLARLYDIMGSYSKAEPFYVQGNNNLNRQIDKNFAFLSEKEKERFLDNDVNFHFDMLNSFFLRRKTSNTSVLAVTYDNELAHKGILLQNNTVLHQAVQKSGDSSLVRTYEQFITLHKTLSRIYTLPIAQRKENADSLENVANTLEKELIKKGKNLPGVENLTGSTKTKWQDVQRSLKPNEVAIEFINFRYFNKQWTDSIFYCALVLRKDYTFPKMVYLFEEKQLEKLITIEQATDDLGYISRLYSRTADGSSENNPQVLQNVLYNLIWHPIDSLFKGINTIYLAPSGYLHKVAFNAIPVAKDTFLSDKYNMYTLSSTRLLVQSGKNTASILGNYSAALYGGIKYDVDSTEMITLAANYQRTATGLSTGRSFIALGNMRGYSWMYLPGTYTEVENIQKVFKSKKISTSLYFGKNATEESFKHLADGKSPEIIHLATHGFYFPEDKAKKEDRDKQIERGAIGQFAFTDSENPLLRSGILLAGASRVWGEMEVPPGVEDGTLTAYEVSNLNLSNTRLIVLSACETGLGDIKGSEGVYGLQRAFKMAGVQYMIMSLWQVPDEETSELMQMFYTNCLNGMAIKEAFRFAQQAMRKKYDASQWAAFVLIE